jgi:hypothetical protein
MTKNIYVITAFDNNISNMACISTILHTLGAYKLKNIELSFILETSKTMNQTKQFIHNQFSLKNLNIKLLTIEKICIS